MEGIESRNLLVVVEVRTYIIFIMLCLYYVYIMFFYEDVLRKMGKLKL